eukprot:3634988-Rhodomonas_salina.1
MRRTTASSRQRPPYTPKSKTRNRIFSAICTRNADTRRTPLVLVYGRMLLRSTVLTYGRMGYQNDVPHGQGTR